MLRKNVGADVRAQAYCWLFHLVGDIHQPLHSTALFSVDHFPKGDEGGNKIKLTRGKSLHSVWDGLLGRDSRMQNIEKLARELQDRDRFGAVWDTAASETEVKQWASESHDLAEAVVYDDAILAAVRGTPVGSKVEPINLPEEYYRWAGEQARKRMLTAGLRLGTLLKTINQ